MHNVAFGEFGNTRQNTQRSARQVAPRRIMAPAKPNVSAPDFYLEPEYSVDVQMNGEEQAMAAYGASANTEGGSTRRPTQRRAAPRGKAKKPSELDEAGSAIKSALINRGTDEILTRIAGRKAQDAPAPRQSFFEKYKMILIGGGVVVAIGMFLLTRNKEESYALPRGQ
jgi:hypothetical protein